MSFPTGPRNLPPTGLPYLRDELAKMRLDIHNQLNNTGKVVPTLDALADTGGVTTKQDGDSITWDTAKGQWVPNGIGFAPVQATSGDVTWDHARWSNPGEAGGPLLSVPVHASGDVLVSMASYMNINALPMSGGETMKAGLSINGSAGGTSDTDELILSTANLIGISCSTPQIVSGLTPNSTATIEVLFYVSTEGVASIFRNLWLIAQPF